MTDAQRNALLERAATLIVRATEIIDEAVGNTTGGSDAIYVLDGVVSDITNISVGLGGTWMLT